MAMPRHDLFRLTLILVREPSLLLFETFDIFVRLRISVGVEDTVPPSYKQDLSDLLGRSEIALFHRKLYVS